MPIRYKPLPVAISRDRERVSVPQWYLFTRIADFIRFNVNEGHRLKERQRQLIAEKGLYNPVTNPTGAAAVSDTAPHIRTGRNDHADDVSDAQAVLATALKLGVRGIRPMSSEPWHIEWDASDLERFYERELKRRSKVRHTIRVITKRIDKATKNIKAARKRRTKLRKTL